MEPRTVKEVLETAKFAKLTIYDYGLFAQLGEISPRHYETWTRK